MKVIVSENNSATRAAIAYLMGKQGFEVVVMERAPSRSEMVKDYGLVVTGFITPPLAAACRVAGVPLLMPTCYTPLAERDSLDVAELAGSIQFVEVTSHQQRRLQTILAAHAPAEDAPAPVQETLEDLISSVQTPPEPVETPESAPSRRNKAKA